MKRFRNMMFAALLVAAALAAGEPVKNHEAREAKEEGSPVWGVLNFAILAGGLGYVAYKKGGPFFAKRTETIRKGLDEAARANFEAKARYAEIERRLAGLGAEIAKLRDRAREESGAEGERLREETGRELEKIKAQMQQDVERAAKAARQELRTYAAELAVALAERRIRERLTPDSENTLLGAMLQDLERRSDAQAARIS